MMALEHFAPRVGEGFDLALGEHGMPLTLVESSPLPVHVFPGILRAPFSLLFRSVSAIVLPQRIYRLKNATLGSLDVFLVPVGRDREGILYQAVFN
jgi:hypothetical protein